MFWRDQVREGLIKKTKRVRKTLDVRDGNMGSKWKGGGEAARKGESGYNQKGQECWVADCFFFFLVSQMAKSTLITPNSPGWLANGEASFLAKLVWTKNVSWSMTCHFVIIFIKSDIEAESLVWRTWCLVVTT